LKFGHHQNVHSLEPDEQDYWLDRAEQEGWSVQEMRRQMRQVRRIEATKVPLPEGIYNVIYADPPWQYSNEGFKGAAEEHYPTMPTAEICQHEIKDRFASDAALFMWVTNPLLEDGLRVMQAWDFDYKTNLCWVKDRPTYGKLGFYVYGRHELLLVGILGSFLAIEKP
jgi:N6-adenosine-specific RNA methylase IME4